MLPKISVVIFTFNRAHLLKEAIDSVRSQSFRDIEIIISDNCSTDDTELVVGRVGDNRLKYFKNSHNLGLRGNLQSGIKKCSGLIVYLMGDDDILLDEALQRTWDAFEKYPEINMVTRPYYWFIDSHKNPVRAVQPVDACSDTLVTVNSDCKLIKALYKTSGQISGLAFRRKNILKEFHEDIFTTHLYLFSDMLKRAPVIILKDFTVAVRINESMCRHNPEIYNKSPTKSWVDMFNQVFPEPQFKNVKLCGIKLMASDCEGLVQIKSFGTLHQLLGEIAIQVQLRPSNVFNPRYIFYVFIVLILTRTKIIALTEWYKKKILSKFIFIKSKSN